MVPSHREADSCGERNRGSMANHTGRLRSLLGTKTYCLQPRADHSCRGLLGTGDLGNAQRSEFAWALGRALDFRRNRQQSVLSRLSDRLLAAVNASAGNVALSPLALVHAGFADRFAACALGHAARWNGIETLRRKTLQNTGAHLYSTYSPTMKSKINRRQLNQDSKFVERG